MIFLLQLRLSQKIILILDYCRECRKVRLLSEMNDTDGYSSAPIYVLKRTKYDMIDLLPPVKSPPKDNEPSGKVSSFHWVNERCIIKENPIRDSKTMLWFLMKT